MLVFAVTDLKNPLSTLISKNLVIGALGGKWVVEDDKFGFKVVDLRKPDTMRGVISTISSVFDPLGLVAYEMSVLKVYLTTIRPVLEDAIPVWQAIPGYLLDKIESLQKGFRT